MGDIRRIRSTRYPIVPFLLCAFLVWSVVSGGRLAAQEGLRVIGTGASATLLGEGLEAGLGSVGAVFESVGASASLDQFCSEEADALLRLSPLTSSARENCAVDSIELLLGHRIYAIAAGQDNPRECLDSSDLNLIFAPSAAGNTIDWQQVDATIEEAVTLSIWLPPRSSPAYALLDQVVSGVGLRADALTYNDTEDWVVVLAEERGSLALIEFGDIPPDFSTLQLQSGEFAGCQQATVENVEAGTYPLAISIYLYLNRSQLEEERILALTDVAVSGALSKELTLPTVAAQEINRSLLTEESQIVSVASDSFVIPSIIGGQVRIGGTAEAGIFLPTLAEALSAAYPSLSSGSDLRGGPASETALCSSAIDIAITVSPLSEEAFVACENAGITVITLIPAAQAVIALSNSADAKMRCMSEERWAAIWAWTGEGTTGGETEYLLFAPPDGHLATDIMMSATQGQALPIRRDTEVSDDPLWRAAAVGVVENGLSYFDWGEYQQVLAAEQQNVQAIKMGSECLAPTEVEILSGNYPLSQPIYVHVNATTLASVQLKSWLWFAFGGSNQALLSESGFVLRDGVAMRRDLLQAFARADALATAADEDENVGEPDEEAAGDGG